PIFTNEQADLLNNIDRHRDLSRTGVAQAFTKSRESIPAILTAYDGATGAYSWIERSFTSYGTRRTMTIVNGGNTFYEGRRGSPTFQPAYEMNGTILDFTDGKRYDVLLTERFVTPDKGQVYEFSLPSATGRRQPTQYIADGVGAWLGPYQVTFLDVIANYQLVEPSLSIIDFGLKLKRYQAITQFAFEIVQYFFDFTPGGNTVNGYLTFNYTGAYLKYGSTDFDGSGVYGENTIFNNGAGIAQANLTTAAQEASNKSLLLLLGGSNIPGLTTGLANFWVYVYQLPS
ncbi:hypothetical protein EBZ38_16220, partial [bacterium]|nr:hypothetical protein [bacterium]NDD85807.1 hypothetical protein [bacterium]NDG19834.1 hypothetical protein [Betaproteobacteria bacterium]